MNVLCLPGLTKKTNEGEHENIVTAVRAAGHVVIDHRWKHWTDPEVPWDVNREVAAAREITEKADGDLAVVAKSIATYVATMLLYHGQEPAARATRLVFLGVPIRDLQLLDPSLFAAALERLFPQEGKGLSPRGRLLIIQNREDPHGSTAEIRSVFSGARFEMVEKNGTTHEYSASEDVVKFLAG